MHIGLQLVAPQGLGSLAAEHTYYLLSNRSDLSSATLAWFVKEPSKWRVHLIRLERSILESALMDGRLCAVPEQSSVPPWLASLEGLSLDSLEDGRVAPIHTYRDYTNSRFNAISPFLGEEFERAFDAAARPEDCFRRQLKVIWAAAKKASDEVPDVDAESLVQPLGNKPNPLRALLWYCTYRIFGRNQDVLIPAYIGIGTWKRPNTSNDGRPFGRPIKRTGALEGHSAINLADRIQEAYVRFSELGVTMVAIHRRALREEFGCEYETLANGQKRPYHPNGLSFPSLQQFRYWVVKEFGLEDLQKRRWGETRYRSRHAAPVGAFSQDSANYLESGEGDVYQIPEFPRNLMNAAPAPKLRVCRLVDKTTGNIFGVGFSQGSETSEAYRLAKFCAVVPRELIGRMFGIPATEETWPGRGLPAREIVDRGPGAAPSANGAGDNASPIRELAQSWSGQAKATVESSHPRNVSLEGQPTYAISHLNVFQMARRELLRTIAENERKDAVDRLTPEMMVAGVAGNPAAITRFLLSRLRTSAVPMATDAAIRKYLRPVEFEHRPNGLSLERMPFSYNHLYEHGLPSRVPAGQRCGIKGFVHPFSLFLAWVEINGRLFEVEPMIRIRDDQEQCQVAMSDLMLMGEYKRTAAAAQRAHGHAAMGEAESLFYKLTGTRWDAADRINGRAKRPKKTEHVPTASTLPKKQRA